MAKKIFLIQDDGTGTEPFTYGIVGTDRSIIDLQDTIDKYKEENPEDYNYDDLKVYLFGKGYELINYEEVYF